MSEFPSTIGVGDAHYAAIGRVTITWAFFEIIIDTHIWRLAEVDTDHGACMTAQIFGSGRKLDALMSLVRHRVGEGPWTKKLNAFAQSTTGLAERRNRMIHDPLVKLDGEEHPRRIGITAKKQLLVTTDPMPVADILKLGRNIHSQHAVLEEIMSEVDAAIAALPSPETPASA
jgi:hypothetical protein